MACLYFTGFETGDNTEIASVSGSYAVGATGRNSGYGCRVWAATTAASSVLFGGVAANGTHAAFNAATTYTRFYFKFATKPSADSEEIFRVRDTGTGVKMTVRIDSDGKLSAWDQTATSQMGSTGATVLSADTWYCIEVKCGTESDDGNNDGAWEIKINGVSELSGTGNTSAVNCGRVYLGKTGNQNGETVDYYYDDLWIDNAEYKGEGQCAILLPDGDGTYTDWTASAGDKYACVDDIAHNSDTDYITTSSNPATYSATLESAAALLGTINAVKICGVIRDEGDASSLAIGVRAGSTDSLTTAADPGASYALRQKLLAVNPDDSEAWAQADITSAEAIVKSTAAVASRCTMLCAMVDYAPSTDPTATIGTASSKTQTTATVSGEVTGAGGGTVSAMGVCWKTSTGPTTSDNAVAANEAPGVSALTASLTGLPIGTTIYCKVYVTTEAGTFYSSEYTFDTHGEYRIGANLEVVTDYATALPFVDLMKTARPWVDDTYTPCGSEITPDANGWPTTLGGHTWVGTLFCVDIDGHYPDGTYHVYYDGVGTIVVGRDASNLTSVGTGHLTFDVETPSSLGILLELTAIDAGDPINNIRVIMPGYESTYETDRWNPTFISRLAMFDAIRFMDWQGSNVKTTVHSGTAQGGAAGYITLAADASAEDDYYNGMIVNATIDTESSHCRMITDYDGTSKQATVSANWTTEPDSDDTYEILTSPEQDWADRITLNTYTWSGYNLRGVPIEVMVELCNKIGADPWFCMPWMATDAYIQSFAEYVEANLNEDKTIYVEWSNEPWNFTAGFKGQYSYSIAKGMGDALDADRYVAGRYWRATRTVETMAIWDTAFSESHLRADRSSSRLVRVFSAEYASAANTAAALAFEVDSHDTSEYIDAVSPSLYYNGIELADLDGSKTTAQLVAEVAADVPTRLIASGVTYDTYADAIARGLYLVSYEGGTAHHVTGGDETENGRLDDVNRHEDIYDVVQSAYQYWYDLGKSAKLCCLFQAIGRWTNYGRWGHLEHLDQTPSEVYRWDAVADWFGANAPTVTTAAASSVGNDSAVLGGEVTDDGGATVTECGICWNTTGDPDITDTKVAIGTGTGAFSDTVGSLPAGTTIYYNAYATNSVGTSYGTADDFTTVAGDPYTTPAGTIAADGETLTLTWTRAGGWPEDMTGYATAACTVTAGGRTILATTGALADVDGETLSVERTLASPVYAGETCTVEVEEGQAYSDENSETIRTEAVPEGTALTNSSVLPSPTALLLLDLV